MFEERIGPYRIAEVLGTGGMGEVFKAYDETLGRWVALKRIRTDQVELAEDNRERLRREARAVARLNHPSIVQVYHVFQDGDSDCIVMEFAEGETLDRVVARRVLTPARAAAIGRDVALGLAEAHAKGIIHRDLKTENVVVTPEGPAKILDFGLAKPIAVEGFEGTSLTGKGQLVGTSRAMAPEYVGGGEVDARADLFALGVLLYEVLTGESPFRAHNTLATLKRVILHEPPAVTERNARVPPALAALIGRLLAKEPDERPASADQVAEVLGTIVAELSSEEVERPPFTPIPPPRSDSTLATTVAVPLPGRRPALVAAIALGVIGLAVSGWLALGRTRSFAFAPQDRIVLGDFVNTTGEALLDDSLAAAFRLGLEQSRYAVVVPAVEIRESLARMQRDAASRIDRELGSEICLREGARALVLGSVVEVGGAYALSAEVVDPRTGTGVYTVPPVTARGRDDLLAAIEEVTGLVRRHLGESLQAVELDTRPLEKVTTRDLRALQRYSRGLGELAEGDYDEAIALLGSAVELDPEFAMAHARLGLLYHSIGRGGGRARLHFERALAANERLTEFERLYVEGWLATLRGTPEQMVERWSALAALFPEEVEGHHNLGMVRWLYQNRFAEAAEAFAAASRVRSGRLRPQAFGHRGYCLLALGRDDEAVASFEEAWRLERSHVALGLADAWAATDRVTAATAFLEGLDDVSEVTQREARRRLALLAADGGRFRRAVELLRPVAAGLDADGLPRRALLVRLGILAVFEASGDRDAFADAVAETAPLLAPELLAGRELDLAPVPALAVFGRLAARAGRLDLAREIEERAQAILAEGEVPLWRGYVALLAGEIALAEGRPADAVAAIGAGLQAADVFALRESLARAREAAGDAAGAIAEHRWIVDHRGRAFAECDVLCGVREANVLAWSRSLERLGELHAERGEPAAAAEALDRLAAHWSAAEDAGRLARVRAIRAGLPRP